MTDQDKIDNVLANFIQKIQSINTSQKANKIIKDIDKLTYKCYEDLFAIFDSRKSVIEYKDEKRGHCC